MPTSSTFGMSSDGLKTRSARAKAKPPPGSAPRPAPGRGTVGTGASRFHGAPASPARRSAELNTTPPPPSSSDARSPYDPAPAPKPRTTPKPAWGANTTPKRRVSLVERQAQYALPSSASRTRPSGGPGASGTSPVARPAVAARRALAAGSAAPSRTAAAPTPSRGLERGLKTPGEKTPATSSRLAKTAAAASPAGARATSVRAKTKSRNDPAAAEPSPPTSPGAESHLGRPLRLRLDAAADADTAQTPGPAATAHEIPSAPRSRPAREAPPPRS